MVLVLLSGCAALAHELLWTRRMVVLLGASAASSTRGFGCFFLGLAVGAGHIYGEPCQELVSVFFRAVVSPFVAAGDRARGATGQINRRGRRPRQNLTGRVRFSCATVNRGRPRGAFVGAGRRSLTPGWRATAGADGGTPVPLLVRLE